MIRFSQQACACALLITGSATFGHAPDQHFVNMNGCQVVPGPGDPDGLAYWVIEYDDETPLLRWLIFYSNIGTPTEMHFHIGEKDEAGPILKDLGVDTEQGPGTTLRSDASGTDEQILELMTTILANPTGYYIDIHTDEYPDGAVRAQLGFTNIQGGPTGQEQADEAAMECVRLCPDIPLDPRPSAIIPDWAGAILPQVQSVPITSIDLLMNDGVTLQSPTSWCTTSTGGSPPGVTGLVPNGAGQYIVNFDGPLEVGEWTTVSMTVEAMPTVSTVQADVCFQIGRHPGDLNMDGDIGLPDASKFASIFNAYVGAPHKLGDLNDDGDVGLPDVSAFGPIFSGSVGAALPPRPPCTCP